MPGVRQPHAARRALQQPLADVVFQPAQLHADSRLRARETHGGRADPARFGDRHEGSEKAAVEIAHY
ncbi:hypothetical protein PTKU64_19780 [Paraburkholderia terrae]|uniref:Uncharacterized protein n=1 Tax=Paraburkholderia terrae TaxID=311230 RepID=A0ABM7TTP9_9BURK|nr:hypothetical protein PTKU64_19780 [Paraburkholderia terrae]